MTGENTRNDSRLEILQRELRLCQQMAEEAGQRRLREAESASALICRLRQVERELHEANTELEQRVRERTVELETANQQLLREIAERRKAEEDLRESEERFRLFMQHFPGLAYMKDAESRTLFANDGFRTYLRINPSELIGRASPEVFPGEFAAKLEADDRRILATGCSERIEEQFAGRHWATYKFVIPQPGSAPVLGGLTLDITDLKRIEESRLQLERQVQQAQKLESLGVLAGGIAHDFNNLLMAILGNAELASDDIPRSSPARESIDEIIVASRRASDLCRQMLAYAGKARFTLEVTHLNSLIEDMPHLLRTSISKKARLKLSLGSGLPALRGDPTQIRQVIMNLVLNASEALEEKEGEVSIGTGVRWCSRDDLQTARLESELPEGQYLWVDVSDTGTGMDEATRRRIFEPFFTTKFAGRGLGLAVVMGIVRSHQGGIVLQSEPGEGTTFRILLPAVDATVESGEVETGTQPGSWKGTGTILLVDDEEVVRTTGRRLLERLGFTVLTAADGCEAVTLYHDRGREIALVLLDMTMPRLSGEETLQELRRLNPAVRVVLASGYNEASLAARLEGRGLAGFLEKPYTKADLEKRLRAALEP